MNSKFMTSVENNINNIFYVVNLQALLAPKSGLKNCMVFEELYLLHSLMNFNSICSIGFHIKSSSSGRKLNPIQYILKM